MTSINNKKRISVFLLLVFVIILIAFFAISMINKNNTNNADNTDNSKKENKDYVSDGTYVMPEELKKEIEEMDNSNSGGIDKDSLNNAKIENNVKINTSEKLSKDKDFEGLKFTNISLKEQNGVSNITATVINKSGKLFKEKNILFVFVNNNGNEMFEIPVLISDLGVEGQTQIDSSITEDVINAYDFKIENMK